MKRIGQILLIAFSFALVLGCNRAPDKGAKDIVSKYKAVFSKPPEKIPSKSSVDAPMLGNGYTGIAISGKPEKQIYHIARNDFWRLKSSFRESYPAVLGELVIDIPDLEGSSYLIEQDFYSAKTFSFFEKEDMRVDFKSFISATEDLLIIELSLRGNKDVQGEVSFKLPPSSDFPCVESLGENPDKIFFLSRAFNEDVDISTKSSMAFRVIDEASNTFILETGKKVVIACAFSSNFKSDNCTQTVTDLVKNIERSDIKKVDDLHEQWWANYWSKSYVDIQDSLIEHQYYLSNYNLASFSRDKDFPPSIFGSCITQERPAWNGDYYLNYNHMAPYYGLYSSNHIEQADSYNAPILAMMERGKYYSEAITGIEDGIMLPVGIGPLGIETTRRNKIMEEQSGYTRDGNEEEGGLFFGQKSNSSYCVVNMALQFYHTYDPEYISRVYPFVESVATFWEKYLVFENGRYVIYGDAIHEGSGKNINPILSLGFIRLVMQTAIDMTKELGKDENRVGKWQHILDNLSDYTYQQREGKTVFRYTEEGTDWWVNNTLGIQHIYPGGQIGLESDPKLLQVAHNTIDVMQRWIDGNGSNSFFPAAVRVGYNPDIILDRMHQYIQHTYPNGFQLNNPHGIENLSTVPNTINEMLCMGHGGVIRVFPVWPKDKNARFCTLRTYGAFLVSSELIDGEVQYLEIISEKGKDCIVENPWPGMSVLVSSNMNRDQVLIGERLKIETAVGEVITLNK